MITHPSSPSVASTRYLEDLFLHLRGRSRRVTEARETVIAGASRWELDDRTVAYENAVGDFLAAVAPAAVAMFEQVHLIAPGYADAGQDAMSNLGPAAVDELVRPIFEAAGILEDFVPWREAFPRFEPDQA